MAQRQPVLTQLLLQPRACRPSLDPRCQRLRVHLQDPIEPAQVERDERPVAQPPLDAADDAGPAAEGDGGGALGLTPAQHRLDLRFVPREGDQVRWVLELPAKAAHHVAVGLAQRVRDPLVALVREEVAEAPRRLQPRRPQLDRLQRHRLLDLAAEAEPLPNALRRRSQLLARRLLILVSPAPVLEASRYQ
jgi:hypothetical protein